MSGKIGATDAHLCRAARFVAVSSTRISVDYDRPFTLEAMITSYRQRILTRFDAKYPGSAKSSGRPRSIMKTCDQRQTSIRTSIDVPLLRTLRLTLRELMSHGQTSKRSLSPSPQLRNGKILNTDRGTA